MNHGTLDMLTATQLVELKADMGRLLTDTQIGGQSCTFRARGTSTYLPGAGTVSASETSTPITATLTPVTESEVAGSDSLRIGDVHILIATSQLTTAPRVDDRLTTATKTYTVVSADSFGMATHYELIGREAP